MLTVTTPARHRLMAKLAGQEALDDEAFRFARRPGGWRLCLDRACPGDTVIKHDGRTVLILDEAVSDAMSNGLLDVKATDAGPRLDLRAVDRRKD